MIKFDDIECVLCRCLNDRLSSKKEGARIQANLNVNIGDEKEDT